MTKTLNLQEKQRLQIARSKLIALFDKHPNKFLSLRYIEICTQVDTSILRLLLGQSAIAYGNRRLNIEYLEGNYRAIPMKLRKLSGKGIARRDRNRLVEKAANHAIARNVPKTKARLAAMNAFPDVD
jgi:DUF1009 family protein